MIYDDIGFFTIHLTIWHYAVILDDYNQTQKILVQRKLKCYTPVYWYATIRVREISNYGFSLSSFSVQYEAQFSYSGVTPEIVFTK